jgi:3-hydroxyacyl-[acyl-carrier-protein] dehydratase
MEYEKLARKYRKKPVADINADTFVSVNYGQEEIKRLIPHRDPFLLLDRIENVDLTQKAIIGMRHINPADPLFKGHFPDYPIYPGVLQLEFIGQLAICYYSLAKNNSVEIMGDNSKLGVRALKVLHTLFQHEVLPDDEVQIIAKILEEDEYKFRGIGQILKGDKICTIVIAEFFIV